MACRPGGGPCVAYARPIHPSINIIRMHQAGIEHEPCLLAQDPVALVMVGWLVSVLLKALLVGVFTSGI